MPLPTCSGSEGHRDPASVGYIGVKKIPLLEEVAKSMGYSMKTGPLRDWTQSMEVFITRPDGERDLSDFWKKVRKKEAP